MGNLTHDIFAKIRQPLSSSHQKHPYSTSLHSQKRHRLAASCEFYPLAASCQQVAASLLTSSSCSKSVKSDLLQLDICRLAASCCNNLQQACGQQVLTSLIEQLAASLLNASMLMQAAKIRLVAT